MVLTVLFCGVSTEATCQLLRIGASQPEAHHESARLCFFHRPKLTFFSLVFILNLMLQNSHFNNKSRAVLKNKRISLC